MKNKLTIIGASGHGKVVADIAIKLDKWDEIVFLDDNESIKTCMGFKVIGVTGDVIRYKDESDFIVAIGNNETREKMQEGLEEKGLSIISLIHPNTTIGADVKIGIGTVIMAGVVINSSTNIGKGCIINTSSSIDHDNVIEDYVHISPGVNTGGTVKIGKKSWIGIGSIVKNNVEIGKDTVVGAGAVVVKDIKESGIYAGVPAKRIKLR